MVQVHDDNPTVVVVAADASLRAELCRAFDLRGWEAFGAADVAAARQVAIEMVPDLALVDLKGASEAELTKVRTLRKLDASLVIIVLTAYSSIAAAIEAIMCGADHYFCRPVGVTQIMEAFEALRELAPDGPRAPLVVPTLARVERAHIQRVLENCGGNVSQCAKLLGIHRRSLQRKLSRHPPRG